MPQIARFTARMAALQILLRACDGDMRLTLRTLKRTHHGIQPPFLG
ncbi:MAG: hypothetical protein OEW08_07340 [Gammaproteobacteria bacterium]|nr:hypothetical protein [Gammaproteobacteria bacterium]